MISWPPNTTNNSLNATLLSADLYSQCTRKILQHPLGRIHLPTFITLNEQIPIYLTITTNPTVSWKIIDRELPKFSTVLNFLCHGVCLYIFVKLIYFRLKLRSIIGTNRLSVHFIVILILLLLLLNTANYCY